MPSFIVVSGDIIQGSRETEPQKAQEEIRSQYDVAGRFLAGLCDIFFSGDRSRMIIVPGNHDVSQYVTRGCMSKIDADDYKPFVDSLWNDDSNIRRSWKDLKFYNISDTVGYKRRFDDFIDFYNRIFVPVIPEMYQYFDLAQNEGKLEFYVRFDPLTA